MTRQLLLLFILLLGITNIANARHHDAANRTVSPRNNDDSIAQAKVVELLEREHVLAYYDENENTPGDYIYSSQIGTTLKQRPGKGFADYWVQVTDHRRYDTPFIYLNFFVDPVSWEVYYYDTGTKLLWTWDHWKKQTGYRG